MTFSQLHRQACYISLFYPVYEFAQHRPKCLDLQFSDFSFFHLGRSSGSLQLQSVAFGDGEYSLLLNKHLGARLMEKWNQIPNCVKRSDLCQLKQY